MKGIIVGLGRRARSWIDVCRQNGQVELVGYVEPMETNRRAVGEQFGVPADALFSDLWQVVKSVKADFVVDVTPPGAHEAVAEIAFGAGLHVLAEKPMSDSFSAARRIVAAAEAADRVHMIAQNYRFGLAPRTTRRLLAEGKIGRPEQVAVQFFMPWATRPGTHYVRYPYMLLKDMGIHHFDMLRYVLAAEPRAVTCLTWNPSWGWHRGDASHVALFEFDDALRAVHTAFGSSVGRKTPWNGEWHIEGAGGSISWIDDRIIFNRTHPPDQAAQEQVPPDDIPLTGQDAILAEFLAAIHDDREPECSGRDNLRSLAMTTAAVMSAENNRRVEITEILD